MKHLLTTLFITIGFIAFSQNWDFEKPNYKKIEKNIEKKNSNLFYDSLMSRFLRADSAMTLEEKRHLYYGYTFNEKYSPYAHSDFDDSLRFVLNKDELDSLDYNKILKFADSILIENPFDLKAFNYQLYVYEQTEQKENFEKKIIQFQLVVDVLMSSGDGTSKEDAFYVIYTTHEYDLLNIIGFQFGGSQKLIGHYDYLTVRENDANIEGFYFDVSPCLNSMSKMFSK